jgi:hypothetical protein
MTMALPFDRVVIVEHGRETSMSALAFVALPLPKKIRCVLERAVSFYSGETPVDRRLALASLRAERAA